MFFDDWYGLVRVIISGTAAYVALIALLLVSGKRTLSKMNAFDFVITVAIGSTLATILLSRDVALFEGILALALLIALQFVITWLSVRFGAFKHLVKAEPRLLYHRGHFLRSAMKKERITEEEIRQAVRTHGMAALEQAEAVVLETDGNFSVIRTVDVEHPSALENVNYRRDK